MGGAWGWEGPEGGRSGRVGGEHEDAMSRGVRDCGVWMITP